MKLYYNNNSEIYLAGLPSKPYNERKGILLKGLVLNGCISEYRLCTDAVQSINKQQIFCR